MRKFARLSKKMMVRIDDATGGFEDFFLNLSKPIFVDFDKRHDNLLRDESNQYRGATTPQQGVTHCPRATRHTQRRPPLTPPRPTPGVSTYCRTT